MWARGPNVRCTMPPFRLYDHSAGNCGPERRHWSDGDRHLLCLNDSAPSCAPAELLNNAAKFSGFRWIAAKFAGFRWNTTTLRTSIRFQATYLDLRRTSMVVCCQYHYDAGSATWSDKLKSSACTADPRPRNTSGGLQTALISKLWLHVRKLPRAPPLLLPVLL